jgi:hypothetical protein
MGLEPLFSWIPELLGWLLSWLPHGARLQAHEGGVCISGEHVRELRRGGWLRSWYFWVPRFSVVYVDNVKRKVVELPEQLLTTSDGKRVRAGGVLVYHISNAITWLVENEDPEHGVQAEAARVLREWVRISTFGHVQTFRAGKRAEDDLTRLAQNELGQSFGVYVRQLALASFAESDAWDLHHSGLDFSNPALDYGEG